MSQSAAKLSPVASAASSPYWESEQSARLVLESLRGYAVVTTDAAGLITSWRAEAQGLLGWTAAEALGQGVQIFFTAEDRQAHVDQREMNEALSEGRSETERWYVKRDGTRFWGSGVTSPLRDESGEHAGFVRILTDRTEEHRRQQQTWLRKEQLEVAVAQKTAELRASEERWESTFQHAAVGMAISDPATGRYLDANDKLCHLLGYTIEELRALTFYDLTHPDDLAENRRLLEDLVADRIPTFSLVKRVIRLDGSLLWVNLYVALARDAEGHPRHAVAIMEDITARLQAEQELRSTNAELRKANAELEQFAYVSSHDLQEPLRTINVYTQMFFRRYDTGNDQVAKQYSDYIKENVARMQQLIDDLLDYSRTIHTEKHEEYLPSPVDVNVALKDAIAALHYQIDHFKAVITHDVLPMVKADRELVSQVFQSLISNALKFRKSGEAPQIYISSRYENGEAVISVQDNGIGFEEKYAERIFGLFKRLHRHEYAGTGLGLALAKRIVNRYGGRIWATSELGAGALFCFTLPPV